MSPNKRNLMVGVVVLAGLGVLAWMVLKFANRAASFFLTKGTHVRVVATRADGISEGSLVYYRGVNVGRVLTVELGKDEQVHIQAIIDPELPVPSNVEGIIRTGNLLSASASIFLEPLHQVASQVDAAATAPTSAPVRLLQEGDLIKATMPTGNALLPQEFNESLREFQERKLIQHVDEAIVTIREQAIKAGQLMDSIREITGDQEVRGDLRTAMSNIREATEQANRIGDSLEKFSGELNGLSKQASETITEVKAAVGDARKTINVSGEQVEVTARNVNGKIDQIGKLLDQFQSIAAKTQRGEGTAGKLFNDPRLYDNMAATAADLRLMVNDLRRLVQQWEQEGLSLKMK
jgi:phospholipid/cholesterol/gamma-HCH transport system substrate-binding protein